jgi:hypothetical protein
MTVHPLKIIVLGMMGRCPYGGQTWLYLNWLLPFHKLGHDVWYVEDDTVWAYDPVQGTVTDDCSYAVAHVKAAMEGIGLPDRWAFRFAGRAGACWGLSAAGLDELYASCDVLLNVVGATDLREAQLRIPFRVYIETDPVTAELRLARGDEHTRIAFGNHHRIFTYGENYGAADCGVPLNGIVFGRTRQPIDLDFWPAMHNPEALFFTTIGNYRQEGSDVEFGGNLYRWSKHHEWEQFIDLPQRTRQRFELALNIDDPTDKAFLERHGWRIVSPLVMSLDVFGAYPEYFRRSRGEFTVAKDQNVRLRSGWFSERDACYLASGKPVVAQDTGFSKFIPTGKGLFGVATVEEAAAAIEEINRDYALHCKAARALAQEHFDGLMVARRLLSDLGLHSVRGCSG